MAKPDYGIDAPKVIRNLIGFGVIIFLVSFFFPVLKFGDNTIIIKDFTITGSVMIVVGSFMLLYSKHGKFKHRDRILKLHEWKGNENVLDVGSGLGLLMIGAAKKLNSGRSYGIDIFASKDLSNNTLEEAKKNVRIENVSDKIEIIEGNIIKTEFQDNFFDVILSNLCLHNIPRRADREKACEEIFRILKPSGEIIISDFKNTRRYANAFRKLGMKVEKKGTYLFSTFPPLTILKGIKPEISPLKEYR